MTQTDASEHAKGLFFLILAALLFGLNWPLMKIGLEDLGPLWFAALRVIIAAVVLFVILAATRQLHWPRKRDRGVTLSFGLLQMGVFMGIIHYALLDVEVGRSAVLAYTTPLWTVPLAALVLGERMSRRAVVGLGVGLFGIVVLFNPATFPWHQDAYLHGNALLLIAAIIAAVVIVHLRSHAWSRPHLTLLPWQFSLGGIALALTAYALEGPLVVPTSLDFALLMAFNAIAATAFSFWAYIAAAKRLPANTTAMTSLAVPLFGIAASLLIIGERPTISVLIGMALIAVAQLIFHRSATPGEPT